jgi:hypothetical protein
LLCSQNQNQRTLMMHMAEFGWSSFDSICSRLLPLRFDSIWFDPIRYSFDSDLLVLISVRFDSDLLELLFVQFDSNKLMLLLFPRSNLLLLVLVLLLLLLSLLYFQFDPICWCCYAFGFFIQSIGVVYFVHSPTRMGPIRWGWWPIDPIRSRMLSIRSEFYAFAESYGSDSIEIDSHPRSDPLLLLFLLFDPIRSCCYSSDPIRRCCLSLQLNPKSTSVVIPSIRLADAAIPSDHSIQSSRTIIPSIRFRWCCCFVCLLGRMGPIRRA